MDQRDKIYGRLEAMFVGYGELACVPVSDNGEAMASLTAAGVGVDLSASLLPPSTGEDIFVRKGVAERLQKSDLYLKSVQGGRFRLAAVSGYRSPAVQRAAFIKQKMALGHAADAIETDDIKEAVHRMVAVPDVAGHPTGGAIDVMLVDAQGVMPDTGTGMHDFDRDSYVFSPFISKEAWQNRQTLREAMLSSGFAPFDGEWWHFSYGDREWARYYGMAQAHYDQIDFSGV
jgi:D-alanyl-D-alanine dipeptidase